MPGTNVALHAYALCLVHTWSHLTSFVRVLAGQAVDPFKYTAFWWLGTGGGGGTGARSLDRLQCLQCLLCAQMAMLCIYVCLTRARDFCTLQCANH